jgi:hypothetical protein
MSRVITASVRASGATEWPVERMPRAAASSAIVGQDPVGTVHDEPARPEHVERARPRVIRDVADQVDDDVLLARDVLEPFGA